MLFLFPFDVKNYKSDLLREAKNHRMVSFYPFAEKFVPAKYIDKQIVKERRLAVEKALDSMCSLGYSYEDLTNDNFRSKSVLSEI